MPTNTPTGKITSPTNKTTASTAKPPKSGPTPPPRRDGPSDPPYDKRTKLTLHGSLSEGVEPRCLVLNTDRGVFTLLAPPSATQALKPGTTVEVTGYVDRSATTTCQDGTPFRVTSARPS